MLNYERDIDMYIVSPTYRKFDLLVKMIESAEAGTLTPDGYVILDNSAGGLIPYFQENAPHMLEMENLEIIVANYNMGVARGWNALLEYIDKTYPATYALVVNDDIQFQSNTLEMFQQAIDDPFKREEPVIYCGDIGSLNAFSMFCVKPSVLFSTVGRCSELFWPAYYDDSDLNHRLNLIGKPLYRIEGCYADHGEGSATIKSYTPEERALHDHQFRRNTEAYIRMWGGEPGDEKYVQPFNGEDIMQHMIELHSRYGF